MTTKIPSAQFERLKRQAKKLSRELSIPHHESLDRVAAQYGFKNWSLLAKRHTPTDIPSPHPQAEPMHTSQARRTADSPRTRHYLHGDEAEIEPGKYLCRFCDLFVDASHFTNRAEHLAEDHGKRYLAEVDNWTNIRDEKYWLQRPEDPANTLKAPALAARSAFEAARSPFHRWLEQQKGRNDFVGDFATDVLSDSAFPTGELKRRALERRLSYHGDHVIRTLRAAWREFESEAGLAPTHHSSTQKVKT